MIGQCAKIHHCVNIESCSGRIFMNRSVYKIGITTFTKRLSNEPAGNVYHSSQIGPRYIEDSSTSLWECDSEFCAMFRKWEVLQKWKNIPTRVTNSDLIVYGNFQIAYSSLLEEMLLHFWNLCSTQTVTCVRLTLSWWQAYWSLLKVYV